eukprot:2122038-Amphidinium_carterae.1
MLRLAPPWLARHLPVPDVSVSFWDGVPIQQTHYFLSCTPFTALNTANTVALRHCCSRLLVMSPLCNVYFQIPFVPQQTIPRRFRRSLKLGTKNKCRRVARKSEKY